MGTRNKINQFFAGYDKPHPEYQKPLAGSTWQKIGRPVIMDVRPVQSWWQREGKFLAKMLAVIAAIFGVFVYIMLHLNAWLP